MRQQQFLLEKLEYLLFQFAIIFLGPSENASLPPDFK